MAEAEDTGPLVTRKIVVDCKLPLEVTVHYNPLTPEGSVRIESVEPLLGALQIGPSAFQPTGRLTNIGISEQVARHLAAYLPRYSEFNFLLYSYTKEVP